MSAPNPVEYDFDDDDYGHDVCGNIGCEDGWVADCIDGFCVNAEDGCELCLRRCDWCNPPTPPADQAHSNREGDAS